MLGRLFLNIFLSFAFVTSLNRAVTRKPPLWFWCQFSRSSWTYCWLPLARSTDYCGGLVTSTLLLCKFRGLPGSTPSGFTVKRRWKCLGMKRSPQPSGTTPGKPTEKVNRTGSRREENNAKSRKSLFNFKPEKVKKFEFYNIFRECNHVCYDLWNSNALFKQLTCNYANLKKSSNPSWEKFWKLLWTLSIKSDLLLPAWKQSYIFYSIFYYRWL